MPTDNLSSAERLFDYDWLVIGSGFGGSVSALRLSEKGYTVGMLECGKRYEDKDFGTNNWDFRRSIWAPKLGLKGIVRFTVIKDSMISSGSAVGGGSIAYANTLYQPPTKHFKDGQWAGMGVDWGQELAPYYSQAQRMLGVSELPHEGDGDRLLREVAAKMGVEDTYRKAPIGVYFGEPGKTVPDPFFGGEGPERTGCELCGSCMLGCRYNAKNTLMKNYLWFAEKAGVKIQAERTVTDIKPIGAADGSDGYIVTSERSGAWLRKDRQTTTAKGVIVAAGALGTNHLLQRCKVGGSLPNLSDRLGHKVRTNSESILAVTTKDDRYDFSNVVSISSSIYPDQHTHIENLFGGPKFDAWSLFFTLLTGNGTRYTRPLKFLGQVVRHPVNFLRVTLPNRWSRRTMLLLVMQSLDNTMRLVPKRKLFSRNAADIKITTVQDPLKPTPTMIPAANRAAKILAELTGGVAQGGVADVFGGPQTAHILGGAVVGKTANEGVIDTDHRAFGYQNLMVMDGAALPANLGVNPSLTITAMAERAVSKLPAKEGQSAAKQVA